jgi:hypothetical protein
MHRCSQGYPNGTLCTPHYPPPPAKDPTVRTSQTLMQRALSQTRLVYPSPFNPTRRAIAASGAPPLSVRQGAYINSSSSSTAVAAAAVAAAAVDEGGQCSDAGLVQEAVRQLQACMTCRPASIQGQRSTRCCRNAALCSCYNVKVAQHIYSCRDVTAKHPDAIASPRNICKALHSYRTCATPVVLTRTFWTSPIL